MTDFSSPAPNPSVLGQRLLIIGNSCAGKSTLGAQLASVLNVPLFIDIEEACDIAISDDDALDLYDMTLDEAIVKLVELQSIA